MLVYNQMLQFLSRARQVQRAASFGKILFLLLVIALIDTYSFTFMPASIIVSPNIINTTATYTISLLRQYDQNLSATPWNTTALAYTDNVTITFPAQFDPSLITNAICTDVSVNYISVTGFSCVAQSRSIVITNLFTDGSLVSQVDIILDGITNPAIALTTSALIGSIGNDVTAGTSSMTFSAADMAGLTISFLGVVNQTSDMIYELKLSNSIPVDGMIRIQFPATLLWAREISSAHIIPINQALSCYGITSQISNSTIQCAGDINFKIVTVTSALSRTVQSGQTIKFAISGLHAPPSTQAIDTLTVSTHDGSGNKIDIKSTTISGLQAQSLQNFNIRSTLAIFGVNNFLGGLIFSFFLSDTLTNKDTFAIYLPSTSTVTLQQTTSASFPLVNALSTYSNFTVSCQQQSTNPNYNSGSLGNLTFIRFRAPPSTKATSPISFAILLNGYPRMVGSATISAVQNNYTLTVSSNSLIVNTYASYSFVFTMVDPLASTGYYVLTLDPLLSSTATQSATILSNLTVSISSSVTNGIKASPSTQIMSVNGSYQLKLSSLNVSSANIGAQTINITVHNLLNPAAVTSLTSFQISTYYSNSDDLVANARYSGSIVLQPGAITLSPPTSTALTTYTFSTVSMSFSNQNPIPSQGILLLSLPKELTLLVLCQTSLSVSGSPLASTSTNFVSNNSILIKTNAIISKSATVSISITNILSPNSTRPTSTFGLSSYDSSFAAIDVSTNTVSLTISSGNSFNSFTISRSNEQCLNSSNFTLTFQQIQNASNVSVISITFNNLVSKSELTNIYEQVYNSSTGITVETSLSYSIISANEIQVTLSQTSTNTHQIVLKSIVNPPSLAPASQTILLKSLTADGLYVYSQMYLDPIQNTITSAARVADWYFSNIALGQASKLTLSLLAPTNWDNIIYSVTITIPTAFADASTPSCQSSLSGLTCLYSPFTRLLKINLLNSSFLPSPLNFNITLVNPTAGDPQTFQIQTYDADLYGVQSDTSSVVFGNNCTASCRTCQPNDTSSCLSCYSNGNSSLFYKNKCFSICPDGSYQTNNTCTVCTSSCLTCSQAADNCTACNISSSFSLFFSNSTSGKVQCLATCPLGNYNLSNICNPCNSTCSSCDVIGCLTCQSTLYLYNHTCIAACPNTTYLSNLTCLACSSNCSTCSNTSSSCTSCPPLTFLYNFTCSSSCPQTNMFVNINQTCEFCTSSCLTCKQDASNCTSCIVNGTLPLYFNGTCRSDCPELYYSATNSCLSCANLTIGCANCSSPTTCKSCDSGLYLFDVNSSCLSTAPTGYLIINGTLQPCSNNCSACSIQPDNCTLCTGNLSLSNSSCLSSCPNGTVSVNNSCTTCTSPCSTCVNTTTNCSSCQTNSSMFLTGSSCVAPTLCPNGTYANSTTMECTICSSPCVTCSSFSQCVTCVGNYSFLSSNYSCVSTCPSGQISKILNGSLACVSCLYPCQTCANTTSSCSSCLSNSSLFLSGSSCVNASACLNGTYANSTTQSCTTCTSPCSSCSSISNCSVCSIGFYLDVATATCTNNCTAGTVGALNSTSSRNECLPCLSPCTTCSNSTNNCLSCLNTTYLANGTCVNASSCPSGTFGNITSGACDTCVFPCSTCFNETSCKSCQADYYLSNNTCMQFCSNGTYVVNSSGIISCLSCSNSCLGCSLSATKCTSCPNGTFLTNGTCVNSTSCPNGTFANSNDSTCHICSSPCSQCSSLTSCTSCNSSTYLYSSNSSCLSTCPNGTLPYQGQCQSCSLSCQTCAISPVNCTSCSNGTFFTNGSCVNSTSCPNGTFANSNDSTCKTCSNPCSQCSSPTICTSCNSTTYLFSSNSSCLSTCPNGTLPYQGQCQTCNTSCQTCSISPINCTSCPNGTFYINGSCVNSTSCPNGTYANSSSLICATCAVPCSKCQALSSCTSCQTGYYLVNSSCVTSSSCPNRTIAVNSSSGGECLSCSSPCLTCSGSITKCLSCLQNGSEPLFFTNNTCVSSSLCPNGSYANSTLLSCSSCSSICSTCNSTATQCSSCKPGYFLLSTNNSCLTICPSGSAAITSNRTCTNCSSTCLSCSTSTTNCTSCRVGEYNYNYTCVASCPPNLIANSINQSCLPCSSTCATCVNTVSNCTGCSSSRSLYNNTCVTTCPNGYFSDTNVCNSCAAICSTCSNVSSCITCHSPMVAYLGGCLISCPSNAEYNISGVCMSCSQAHPGCTSCNMISSDCQICQSSQSLLNGNCYTQCPSGYTSNGTNCNAITGGDTLTNSLTSTSVFPLPFTITGTIIFAACFMSKLQNSNSYVVGTAYALYGFVETGCLCYLLWTYSQYLLSNTPTFNGLLLLLISLLIIIGLNFLSMTVQSYQLVQDQKFSRWLKNKINYIAFVVISIVSGLFSYKFKMMVFTRLFGFGCLRAQLETVQKFRLFNVFSFIGVAHQGLAIYASALAMVSLKPDQQLFLSFLDLVIINIINICLALAASAKDSNFFQEDDGGYKINKVQNQQEEYEVPALGGEAGSQKDPKGMQSRDQLLGQGHQDDAFTLSISDRDEESVKQIKTPSKFKTYINNKSAFVDSQSNQQPHESGNSLRRKGGKGLVSLDNASAVYSGELSGLKLKKFEEKHQLSPDIVGKAKKIQQHMQDIGSEGKIRPENEDPEVVLKNDNIFEGMHAQQEDEELPAQQDIVADLNSAEERGLERAANKKLGDQTVQQETRAADKKQKSMKDQNLLDIHANRDPIVSPLQDPDQQFDQFNEANQQAEANSSSRQPAVRQIKVYKGKIPIGSQEPDGIEQIDLTIGKKQLQLIALRKKINRRVKDRERSQERRSVRQRSQSRQKHEKDAVSERKGPMSSYAMDMNNLRQSKQIQDHLQQIQLSPTRPPQPKRYPTIEENIPAETSSIVLMDNLTTGKKQLISQNMPQTIAEGNGKGACLKKIDTANPSINNQSILEEIKLTTQNKPNLQANSTYQPIQSSIIEEIPHNFSEAPNSRRQKQLAQDIQDFADHQIETFDIKKQNPLQPAVESDVIEEINQDNSPRIEYEIENINADFGDEENEMPKSRRHIDDLIEQESLDTGNPRKHGNIFEYKNQDSFTEQGASRIDPHKLIGSISRSKRRHIREQSNVAEPTQLQFNVTPDQQNQPLKNKKTQGKSIYDGNASFDEDGFIEEADRTQRNRSGNRSHLLRQPSKEGKTQGSRQNGKREQTQMSGYQQINETSTIKDHSQRQVTERRAAPPRPPLHSRPATSDASRMHLSGLKKKRAPSNERTPDSQNLSVYQIEADRSRQLNRDDDGIQVFPSSYSSNQIRLDTDQKGDSIPSKPQMRTARIHDRPLPPRKQQDSSLDGSHAQRSMKSYRSRSIDRDEAEQKYITNSREKSQKRKGQKDDLDDYYRKKTPEKKQKSKSKEKNKSSEKKLRELEKIYLQRLEFRPSPQ